MRLARTETNAAYRLADQDRWQRMEFGGILRVFVACAACRVPPLLPPYQLTSSPQAFCNTSGYSACGSACVSLPPAQCILFLLTLCVFGNEEREVRHSAVALSLYRWKEKYVCNGMGC